MAAANNLILISLLVNSLFITMLMEQHNKKATLSEIIKFAQNLELKMVRTTMP
jgi:hypothetical protein